MFPPEDFCQDLAELWRSACRSDLRFCLRISKAKMPSEMKLPLWCQLAKLRWCWGCFLTSPYQHFACWAATNKFSRLEIQGFFTAITKSAFVGGKEVCVCALTFEGNLYGCHKTEVKDLLIVLCPLPCSKSADSPKFLALKMQVYFWSMFKEEKLLVFPVTALPQTLPFACCGQKRTECCVLDWENVGSTQIKSAQSV